MSLRRVLGTRDAIWIVTGNMVGSGIFFAPGFVARDLPGWRAPLSAWLLGGVLALCGAAVYGELGARLPRAGGDYEYLTVSYGRFWGFLNGWAAITLTFSAAAAVQVRTSLGYLESAIPGFLTGWPTWSEHLVATAILLLLTWANTIGARLSGRTTAWLTAIPLLGLVGLFGWGLTFGDATLTAPQVPADASTGWFGFGAAMVSIYFAYTGWNAAAYLAGEMKDAGRVLGRALLIGTGLVTLLYLAVNVVILFTLSGAELAATDAAGAAAARRLIGPQGERWLGLVIGTAILGSANVTLMAGARVYYAMARRRLLPQALARTNRAGVPATALWVGGVWAATLGAIGKIEDLLSWTTLAILLLSSLAVSALFVLRRRGVDEKASATSFRCPGYPWTPLLYLALSLFVAVSVTRHDPRTALYGIAFIAAGAPLYLLARGRVHNRGFRDT